MFSRARVERYDKRPVGALGTQALIQFQKVYGAAADTVLGELMLYVFLEEGLDAPKIMSKIEFSQHGGIASRSDGIHLIATTEFGRPFNQLVFGASNIEGKLEQAVDRAFERILKIEENTDIEFSIVENTAYNLVFDDVYQLIERCPCDKGCPSCVGPQAEVGIHGKQTALTLAEKLMNL